MEILTAVVIVVISVLGLMFALGYVYRWNWVGVRPKNTPDPKYQTLLDWTKILIVPVVLALGGYWFTLEQHQADQIRSDQQYYDAVVQGYLNSMTTLLTDHGLASPIRNPAALTAAYGLTNSVLSILDGGHKRQVVQFLYSANLIDKNKPTRNLSGADLSNGADLSHADLHDMNLTSADLPGSNMTSANLSGVDFTGANLDQASGLDRANLAGITWSDTTCPDGSNSDDVGHGATCVGHLMVTSP